MGLPNNDFLKPELAVTSRAILYTKFKRIWETLFIIFSLPVLLPLAILIAIAVRLDSPGPILFFQERLGRHGRTFRMIKFRSMFVNSNVSTLHYAEVNDSRITRVGKVIRKYRLDEMPQVLQVLSGEMAFIGVRPEPVQFAMQYAKENPLYMHRHTFLPGMTGWAQVEHGYAGSADESMQKLEYDLYYVQNISFFLDMIILKKTVKVVFSGFGSR